MTIAQYERKTEAVIVTLLTVIIYWQNRKSGSLVSVGRLPQYEFWLHYFLAL